MDSILFSIKKMLGIQPEYEQFDADIIMLINSALSVLSQIGVGKPGGLVITDAYSEWSDFLGERGDLESVKEDVYLRVRLTFDPPASNVMDAMNKRITELEWRLGVAVSSN